MMRPLLITGALLSVFHFIASWVCFTRSEVIRPDASTAVWRSATEVLAFPLLYLQSLNPGFDPFALLMIVNSLLWGFALAALVVLTVRAIKHRRVAP